MKNLVQIIKTGNNSSNCYLINGAKGYILIITGAKTNHIKLEKELIKLGCISNLKLIIVTQFCSFTHRNLIIFREKHSIPIAMHIIDNVLDNNKGNFFLKVLRKLYRKLHIDEISPDIIIDEGYSLRKYGLNARIINLSIYRKNSIGILTDEGELFCEDLLVEETIYKPSNKEQIYFEKFKRFLIDIVYPGHGNPIQINSLNT